MYMIHVFTIKKNIVGIDTIKCDKTLMSNDYKIKCINNNIILQFEGLIILFQSHVNSILLCYLVVDFFALGSRPPCITRL